MLHFKINWCVLCLDLKHWPASLVIFHIKLARKRWCRNMDPFQFRHRFQLPLCYKMYFCSSCGSAPKEKQVTVRGFQQVVLPASLHASQAGPQHTAEGQGSPHAGDQESKTPQWTIEDPSRQCLLFCFCL